MLYNYGMATIKQRKAIDKLVENGGNISKAMVDAGYSPATAHTPSKLTDSIGFNELCNKLGLTEDFLINALKEDIETKKGNRKGELELGFKVRGRVNPEKAGGDTNIQINLVNYGDSNK